MKPHLPGLFLILPMVVLATGSCILDGDTICPDSQNTEFAGGIFVSTDRNILNSFDVGPQFMAAEYMVRDYSYEKTYERVCGTSSIEFNFNSECVSGFSVGVRYRIGQSEWKSIPLKRTKGKSTTLWKCNLYSIADTGSADSATLSFRITYRILNSYDLETDNAYFLSHFLFFKFTGNYWQVPG